ncbi:MAG: lysophospholipid acyltransferase family protein [Janthinobacterium lividum]
MIDAVRSTLFALVFYVGSVPIVLVAAVMSFVWPRGLQVMARVWAGWFYLTSRCITGVRLRVEGEVPQTAMLVAIKHQAAYETIMILWLFRSPAVVMKAELQDIPFWGGVARRHGTIPVDRNGSASALRAMLKGASTARSLGRPVVIFPEGTRTLPGERPQLRAGLAGLYRALKLPLVPVALDSGTCWPKGFIKHPGTVTMRFGTPIPPGLDREKIEERVHAAINGMR